MSEQISYADTKLTQDRRYQIGIDLMESLHEIVLENNGTIIDGLDILLRCYCMLGVTLDKSLKADDAKALEEALAAVKEFYEFHQKRYGNAKDEEPVGETTH